VPRATLEATGELLEATLLRDQSLDAIRQAVQDAVRMACMDGPGDPAWDAYVCDLFAPDIVVYRDGDDYWRATYTVDLSSGDPIVSLGDPTPVELAYVDSTEDEASEPDDAGDMGEAQRLTEAATRTVDGQPYPRSDWAYTPSDKPSTWKLRLTATPGGAPDAALVGAACAALGPGFRGNKVGIPRAARADVVATVRAAWKKANPGKDASEMPPAIKEAASHASALTEVELREFAPLFPTEAAPAEMLGAR
jgi:hypothetical protein